MKQIKGVVELHGDNIEITHYNNVKCAIIEGVSTYDIYSHLKEQDSTLKIDLIRELFIDLSVSDKSELIKLLGIKV
jgi:putative aminopeptidase FrvX